MIMMRVSQRTSPTSISPLLTIPLLKVKLPPLHLFLSPAGTKTNTPLGKSSLHIIASPIRPPTNFMIGNMPIPGCGTTKTHSGERANPNYDTRPFLPYLTNSGGTQLGACELWENYMDVLDDEDHQSRVLGKPDTRINQHGMTSMS